MALNNRDIERGKFSLLFGTPEAIVESERWRELLLGEPLHVAVAVDEVHCVYKWYKIIDASIMSLVLHISLTYKSAKFRPSFHELHGLVPHGIPMIALMATVTPEIRARHEGL